MLSEKILLGMTVSDTMWIGLRGADVGRSGPEQMIRNEQTQAQCPHRRFRRDDSW
jgi:hypothetical protein